MHAFHEEGTLLYVDGNPDEAKAQQIKILRKLEK